MVTSNELSSVSERKLYHHCEQKSYYLFCFVTWHFCRFCLILHWTLLLSHSLQIHVYFSLHYHSWSLLQSYCFPGFTVSTKIWILNYISFRDISIHFFFYTEFHLLLLCPHFNPSSSTNIISFFSVVIATLSNSVPSMSCMNRPITPLQNQCEGY